MRPTRLFLLFAAVAAAALLAAYCLRRLAGSKIASATAEAETGGESSGKKEETADTEISSPTPPTASPPISKQKIQSIPTKLLPIYEHAREFILDGNWTRLLSVADAYKNGAYPDYVPDEDMALRLYHMCARCPDAEVAGLGQSRYVELRLDPLPPEDRFGSRIPPDPGIMISGEADERISKTPSEEFSVPTRRRIAALDDRQDRAAHQTIVVERQMVPAMQKNIPKRHHLSDAQNVHDHGVSATVRKSIETLVSRHGAQESRLTEAEEKARDAVLVSLETGERQKMEALEVLESLRRTPHSGFGVSEAEVLALTVAEIGTRGGADLWETLAKQLSTGVESGIVVCSSGKITRIVGVFDGTDAFEDAAKPMWAIRDEIGTLAAKMRSDFPDDARAEFSRRAEEEYVERLGMSKQVLAPIIEEYADAL